MIRVMEQRIYRLARAGNIDTNPTTFIQRAALFASAATGNGAATLLTRREASVADALGIVEGPDGNAIIHEVAMAEPFTKGRAPVAAIAVDLMASLVIRERSTRQRIIVELLRG